ncbi:uncharacterized protein BXZ73DRAFT_55032 [Epithele typhae]|uniref:uncharacterized protein n=1 Tax=Epithele typhae TaxID=378194 RepID=UPI0020084F04|nr:uncharacterized protein BXZ73DRAFT_55032 [Epithele typhae]KAH9914375.1 hypothetical protein BXZ73DRAFT_55032 [Epithele typhae]
MADNTNQIFQNGWYVGNNFNAILYGVELVFYFATVKIILDARKQGRFGRSDKIFLLLSTFLLAMVTAFLIVQAIFGEEMWVVNEFYPGGTAQYFADHSAVWYETFGSAAAVAMNLASDAFLIHRTYVVWGLRPSVILFPCFLWLGTAALGIATCVISGQPNSDFFLGLSSRVALSYSAVSIAMNVTCTCLICGRIMWASRRVGDPLARAYSGPMAMIVESMLPYALFGVAYLVTLGLNHPLEILFLSFYVMFMCISPQMIILRLLMGRGAGAGAAGHTSQWPVLASVEQDNGNDPDAMNLQDVSSKRSMTSEA